MRVAASRVRVNLNRKRTDDHAWGRDFAARIENQGEKIVAEVIRRIGDHGLDVVKEAVEDALEGRRPKW
jgi:hypothetical protein